MDRKHLRANAPRWLLLATALAGFVTLASNLFDDAADLSALGDGLARHEGPLQAPLARAAGNVIGHLAFRTSVHGAATLALLVLTGVLVARFGRGPRGGGVASPGGRASLTASP